MKSASLPLVALKLKTADLTALAADLERRFRDTPNFFDRDPVVIDLANFAAQEAGIDAPAIRTHF